MTQTESSIIPRKTVLGSYIIMRRIAAGGMGTVWEGWLNPYAELGSKLISGEARQLRAVAGVKSSEDRLSEADVQKIKEWVEGRTAEFIGRPDLEQRFAAAYSEFLEFVAPHRRIAGDFRRAIKVLDEGLARNPKVVQRFLKEIDILASTLNHPCVIKVVESGQGGGRYYGVMEFVPSLNLEETRITIPESVVVIRQALEGLIHAHEQNILHRDIKPANILVTRDFKKVKLTDFGLAKALDSGSEGKLTSTGVIMGTPNYLDPERARGEQTVKESDVFSLGATFYKLLTGQPPAQGTSPLDTMGQIGHEKDLPWVRTLKPQVSEELEEVVMMMLSKDVRRRLTSYEVRDLLTHLEANNLALYQEAPPEHRIGKSQAARALRKQVKTLQKAAPQGDRDRAATELYEKYGELAALLPRDTAAGVSARLDAYAEAVNFHRAAFLDRKLEVSPATAAKVALLEKRLALERRRLDQRGFTYVAKRPRRLGRRAAVAVAGLAVIAMAALFAFTKVEERQTGARVDQALAEARTAVDARDYVAAAAALAKGRDAARALPQSSPQVGDLDAIAAWLEVARAYDQALRLYKEVEQQMARKEYTRAERGIQAADSALRGVNPRGAPELELAVNELAGKIQGADKRIHLYIEDIRVYARLMETVRQAESECRRMEADAKAGKKPLRKEVQAVEEQVARTFANLKDPKLVNPASVGPELAQSLRDVQKLVDDLAALRAGASEE